MEKNYQYFMKANVDSYIGQWVAVCKERIVAHGTSAKKVFEEAKEKCTKEIPFITKVPDKETMIF